MECGHPESGVFGKSQWRCFCVGGKIALLATRCCASPYLLPPPLPLLLCLDVRLAWDTQADTAEITLMKFLGSIRRNGCGDVLNLAGNSLLLKGLSF